MFLSHAILVSLIASFEILLFRLDLKLIVILLFRLDLKLIVFLLLRLDLKLIILIVSIWRS